MIQPDQTIIRTDSIGRIRISAEHREQLLDSYEQSSLAGTKFAKLHGIKYQTFATWVQKRKRQRGEYELTSKEAPPEKLLQSLVELDVTAASHINDALSVEHTSGVRLSVSTPAQAQLAATLLNNLKPQTPC